MYISSKMRLRRILGKFTLNEIIFFSVLFLFSSFLMFHTFSYQDGEMLIAAKAWSDFSGTIPIIRSFSMGDNFPPEYPLFAGPPIRYHFVFYLAVGIMEKIGLPIDIALNSLSIIGFFSLLLIIYFLGKTIFKSFWVGFLSVLFFLFNSSGSFVYFIMDHPDPASWIANIVTAHTFSSFGPYDGRIVSAFWNLNIYTNQRHLAFAYALSLILIFIIIHPIFKESGEKKSHKKNKIFNHKLFLGISVGLILGLMFFLHLAVFMMTCIILAVLFLSYKQIRLEALIAGTIALCLAIPQYIYFNSASQGSSFPLIYNPGYLSEPSLYSQAVYWAANLGISTILIPIGFFLSSGTQKKIFFAFFALFVVGNLFQFSAEIAANHKFFNLFLIVGNMYSASAILTLWKKSLLPRIFASLLIFFMVISGIIDFFPIYNDQKIRIEDYPKNGAVSWIIENTEGDSVFLNTSYLYPPESLAGRKIMLGWPYFPWSLGFDTNKRVEFIKNVFAQNNKEYACKLLQSKGIDYILKSNPPDPNYPEINEPLLMKFKVLYNKPATKTIIYGVKQSCKNI